MHDYLTGKAMAPEGAWFVEGSHAMACDHDAMHMDDMRRPEELAFDRCSPGTFTFASQQEAEAFMRENGGAVVSFGQLMSEAQFQ